MEASARFDDSNYGVLVFLNELSNLEVKFAI